MKKFNAILFLLGCFLLSGCVVRTYRLTQDRTDQDLSVGNRGYIMGHAPAIEEKERRATRSTRAIEIELHSPLKFEKIPKGKNQAMKLETQTQAQQALEGNRGYITQSISPEIAEPIAQSSRGVEKYTVQKNDTLQKISQKYYGTTKNWMKIYDLNKDVLKAPNKIYPGQVINVPVESVSGAKGKLK